MLKSGIKSKLMLRILIASLCLNLLILGYSDVQPVRVSGNAFVECQEARATHYVLTFEQLQKVESVKREKDYLYKLITEGAGELPQNWAVGAGVSTIKGGYVELQYKIGGI